MDEDYMEEDPTVMESKKMSIKPKGVGIGSPKFKYDAKPHPNSDCKP